MQGEVAYPAIKANNGMGNPSPTDGISKKMRKIAIKQISTHKREPPSEREGDCDSGGRSLRDFIFVLILL